MESSTVLPEINVAACLDDPDSVFYYYQQLVKLRHELPIIVYGSFEPLLEDDPAIYAYRRELDGQVLTVACNWTDREVACDLFGASGERLIGNYAVPEAGTLKPYEAYVTLA